MDDRSNTDAAGRPNLAAVAALAGVSAVDGVARLQRRRARLGRHARAGARRGDRAQLRRPGPARPVAAPRPLGHRRRRHRGPARDAFRDPMNIAMLDGIAEDFGDERLGLLVLPRRRAPSAELACSAMDAAILLGCSTDSPRRSRRSASAGSRRRDRGRHERRRARRSTSTTGMPAAAGRAPARTRASRRRARHPAARGQPRTRRAHAGAGVGVDRVHDASGIRGARDVFPSATGDLGRRELGRGGRDRAGGAARRDRGGSPDGGHRAERPARGRGDPAAEELGIRGARAAERRRLRRGALDGRAPYELTTLVQPAVEKGRPRRLGGARGARRARRRARPAFTSELRIGSDDRPAP